MNLNGVIPLILLFFTEFAVKITWPAMQCDCIFTYNEYAGVLLSLFKHINEQDAQLSQRDRAAGCVIVPPGQRPGGK